jgi:hypothetical protein
MDQGGGDAGWWVPGTRAPPQVLQRGANCLGPGTNTVWWFVMNASASGKVPAEVHCVCGWNFPMPDPVYAGAIA